MNTPRGTMWRSALVCAGFVGLIAQADAATLTVCKQGCKYSQINSAVAAATSGDTISIGSGTFVENVVITDKSLTLTGYSEDYTVIDGGFHGSALTINGTSPQQSTVNVNKLTLTHGSTSGISTNESTLNLQKVIVISNVSGAAGGDNGAGINAIASVVNISGSIIAHNRAPTGLGGGLYAAIGAPGSGSSGSVVKIDSSDIFENSASEGGGLYVDEFSKATLSSSTLTSNSAKRGGGAYVGVRRYMSVSEIGFVTFNSSTIANNTASDSGGAFYVPIEDDGGAFNNSLVVGNKAGIHGGAIYFPEYGSVDLRNTVFAGNQPDNCDGGTPCP